MKLSHSPGHCYTTLTTSLSATHSVRQYLCNRSPPKWESRIIFCSENGTPTVYKSIQSQLSFIEVGFSRHSKEAEFKFNRKDITVMSSISYHRREFMYKTWPTCVLVILMPRKRPSLRRTSSWQPQPSFHTEPIIESGSTV